MKLCRVLCSFFKNNLYIYMSKPEILIKNVINDYFNNNMSLTECSIKYNIVPSTVFTWVRKYNTNKEFRDKYSIVNSDTNEAKKDELKFVDIDADTLKYSENDFKALVSELLEKDIIIERFKKGYYVQDEKDKSYQTIYKDFEVVYILQDKYPVSVLLNKMHLSRTSFYKWIKKNNMELKGRDKLYIEGMVVVGSK